MEEVRPRRWPMEAVRREAKLEQSDDDGVAICPPLSIYPLSQRLAVAATDAPGSWVVWLLVARAALLCEPKRFVRGRKRFGFVG